MSNSAHHAGAAVATTIAVLTLIVAALQLVHDVYGVGPAPITYVFDRINGPTGPETPNPPPGWGTVPTGAFDTEPPTVPQNLRISARRATQTGCTVILAWDASTDNTGVQSYPIYADGNYSGQAPGSSSTFSASLFPGRQESFTISASDGSNKSGQSNAVVASC